MSEIIIADDNSVRVITLNRPDKRNALNDALINDLKAALRETAADETLRELLSKARGKIFVPAQTFPHCKKFLKAM